LEILGLDDEKQAEGNQGDVEAPAVARRSGGFRAYLRGMAAIKRV
jgi:hypothetical protein